MRAPLAFIRQRSLASLTSSVVAAAALSLVGTLSIAGPPTTEARTFGANGQLAFDRNGGEALFTINADGTNERKLFDSRCCPSWSPDGSRIMMPALTDDGRGTFATFDPDGSDIFVAPIDDPALEVGCEAWSPDGTRVLCGGGSVDNSLKSGLFTRRASDGLDVVRLTTNPTGDFDQPGDYSPDGSRIAFIRYDSTKKETRAIFIMNSDGSGPRQLTPWGVAGCCNASWSPDGQWILFDERWRLFLIRPDGSGLHQVVLKPGGRHFAYEPVWSPDGTRIAFSMWANGQDDIYTADPDGGNLFQVTDSPEQEGQVDWGSHQP